MNSVYSKIHSGKRKKRPQLAVLIDPDKFNPELVKLCRKGVSYFFVGGSKLDSGNIGRTIAAIKKISKIPVVIFPGDEKQVSGKADALLFLSLLSGRNPEYLIGKHVLAAPVIKRKKLECIPTAYILVNGERNSTTQKVTGTKPLQELAQIKNTALAGELLGFKLLYLEAGSGAKTNIPAKIIAGVKRVISIPLLVGGGIDSVQKVRSAIRSGADIVVIGNALEKNIGLIEKIAVLFK